VNQVLIKILNIISGLGNCKLENAQFSESTVLIIVSINSNLFSLIIKKESIDIYSGILNQKGPQLIKKSSINNFIDDLKLICQLNKNQVI
jgi:hypothetical protein